VAMRRYLEAVIIMFQEGRFLLQAK
jgi:hypothetical protein